MKEFKFNVRVYFSDTDAGGIVYHASYLNFAEHARTEALREISLISQSELLKTQHLGFVVKSIYIDYLNPAFVDDELTVCTTVKEMKRFSAIFSQEIKRGDDVLTTVETKVGCIDLDKKRPYPIPEEIEKGFLD